jgi:hypothetical protein
MLLSTIALIFSFLGLLFTTLSAWFFSRPLILKDDEIEKIPRTHGSPNPYAHDARKKRQLAVTHSAPTHTGVQRESPQSAAVCAGGGCGAGLIPTLVIFPVYFP